MSAKRAPETTSLDARRWRVDSMLSGQLGLALLHKGDPEAKQRMLTPHEAELRAYVVAGVLSEADAEAWRARFAAAERAVTAPDSEVRDRATRTRATELLEELLKARTSDDEQTKGSSFYSALGAFTAIGLISTEEQREWNVRARPAPSPPRHDRLPDRPSYTAAELRTVLAGPLERLGGVRLLCAELYSDCVIVRWHRLLTPEEAAARDDHNPFLDFPRGMLEEGRRWGAVFDLSDDLSTRYELAAGDSGGSHEYTRYPAPSPSPVWGYSALVPSVPANATRLEAVNGAERFVIQLDARQ